MIDTPTNETRNARERFPQYYEQLRNIAGQFLSRERPGHTLQPTALVHEAFLRMCRAGATESFSDEQWVRAAATNMRQILVEHARRKKSQKRKPPTEIFLEPNSTSSDNAIDLLALDDALNQLQQIDPELVQLIELRCFAGLTEEQAATIRGVAPATIRRDWRLAKRWLYCAIAPAE